MQACRRLYHADTWSFIRFMSGVGNDVIPFGCVQHRTQLLRGKPAPSFPFAYLDVGTPNEQGHMALCYAVATTEALQLPLLNETPCVPKKTRLAMKKRMAAQLLHY
jgi:hypothetical protein